MPVRFANEYAENEVFPASGPRGKLFGRERSIHEVLGGGKGKLIICIIID